MPYSEWEHAGRYRWNDLFATNRETAVRTQAQVDMSACATITETMNGKSYGVRVCTADSEGITLHAMLTCMHSQTCIYNLEMDNYSSARIKVGVAHNTSVFRLGRGLRTRVNCACMYRCHVRACDHYYSLVVVVAIYFSAVISG